MILQSWSSFSSALLSHFQADEQVANRGKLHHLLVRRNSCRRASFSYGCFSKSVNVSVGIDDLADIIHNRVLIAAALSAAVGQFLKPLTSTVFYRKNFDFKNAFQAGGFPSTHSSTVVAAATSLGLERGFADAIFGLAVVYAGLIMYDAQGVRREVGTHAKTLNRVLLETPVISLSSSEDPNDMSDTFPRSSSSSLDNSDTIFLEEVEKFQTKKVKDTLLLEGKSTLISSKVASDIEGGPKSAVFSSPLKESIGHTEIEVIGGALLGFFISLAVCIL